MRCWLLLLLLSAPLVSSWRTHVVRAASARPPPPPHRVPFWEAAVRSEACTLRSVQRLALSDAARCIDEVCSVEQGPFLEQLSQSAAKVAQWVASREPLIRWATRRWLQAVAPPTVVPYTVYPADDLTLKRALVPIRVRNLAWSLCTVSPAAVCRLAWSLCLLWAVQLLPPERAARQQQRIVPPLLEQIAAAYEKLVNTDQERPAISVRRPA